MERYLRRCLLLLACACWGQDLHFKTRTLATTADALQLQSVDDALRDTSVVHKILQYDHPPGAEEVAALLRDGITVVGALPDNAVIVSAPGGKVNVREGISWAGPMDAADKLSPALTPNGQNGDQNGDQILALIEFHSDVTPGQQDTVAGAAGVELRRVPYLQTQHGIVSADIAALRKLAVYDEVAYIFPADPDLTGDTAPEGLLTCTGMLTTNGMAGQYATIVHGWDLDPDHFLHLTYLFGSVTPKIPALTVRSEVLRALSLWTQVTNLTFQPGTNPGGPRNILIKFVSGAHGDSYPFDGPTGSLAHTFYPVPVNAETLAGDMHLDADENWHAGGDTDIFSVALHEAGHAIGLGHSDKPGDVMYPYYHSHSSLSANDIAAAQSLYGKPAGSAPAPITQPTDPVPPPALRLTVDAVPVSTTGETTTLSGTATGGKAPVTVQWQTSGGATGKATLRTQAWNTTGIPLVVGDNAISINAYDGALQSAAAAVTVTRQAAAASPSTSNVPLSVAIRTPAPLTSTVSGATLTLGGVAASGSGISRVTWQTSAGAAGIAQGTTNWLAAGVPLYVGTNTIVVKAWDARGSSAWASTVVVRR